MKKIKHILAAIALVVSGAGSANAASLVAGWDFSQYFSDSVLSIDNGNSAAPSTLQANYSSLDPSGYGAESAAFGTMHLPFTPIGDASEPFIPTAVPGTGSLLPNINQGPYDNSSLTLEGQPSFNLLAMLAQSAVSIVFEADLSSIGSGANWLITLAGATQPGLTGTVGFEFSTDGVSYVSLGSQALTSSAIAFSNPQGAIATSSDRGFFRLSLSQGVVIDNVGISADITVPEPLTASLLFVGLGGLAVLGRRRS